MGCHRVWLNTSLATPTVVSKVALANGLVYSYTTDASGDWYWTTLSFATGKLVYKSYSGTGTNFNNNYAGISISPEHRETWARWAESSRSGTGRRSAARRRRGRGRQGPSDKQAAAGPNSTRPEGRVQKGHYRALFEHTPGEALEADAGLGRPDGAPPRRPAPPTFALA